MSVWPTCMQSTPCHGFFVLCCLAFMAAISPMALRPLFSARAMGMMSSAAAQARMLYWSTVCSRSDASTTAKLAAISLAPPPGTTRGSRIKFRTQQLASCRQRLASSMTIWFPPRTRTVTALEFAQSSITSICSLVVPNVSSLTTPALPSFSADSSSKRGTIRPPVAIAMSSSSTPPTHRTAGNLFWYSKWFASSSKPHWQITRFAPQSFNALICVLKYCCSFSYSFL
mmetsp:Transcript_53847/g.163552  ORF Transcript_53847/g.163552 Transcript_53847/m.163552 type:complete len:228 (+) Transcript_53847:226-909(+)